MIIGYIGLPGAGKSSVLSSIARKYLKKIQSNKCKYKHIVSNFPLKGVTLIEFKDLGNYNFEDTLILLDEMTLEADCRKYKSFPQNLIDFFILHRHLGCDVVYATQDPSAIDKRIRDLTAKLFFVKKLGSFAFCREIRRKLNVNEFTSELTLGYAFASFLQLLFGSLKVFYLRPAWKLFDSYDLGIIQNRPNYFDY